MNLAPTPAAVLPSRVFLAAPASTHAPLLSELSLWVAQGWLRALDLHFAAFLAQRAPDADPLLLLAAALASHQLGRGHACLDLRATLADSTAALALPPEGARWAAMQAPADADAPKPPAVLLAGLTPARWTRALAHDGLVGDGAGNTPLVRVGHRLYLRRYWQYEQSVRAAIRVRVGARVATPTQAAHPALQGALAHALDVLFPHRDGDAADWQKMACALVARQAFGIVTGGPGTGKTTTVVRLLAVLQHLAFSAGDGGERRPLRIRMAAPTGKAAARLNASIAGAVATLPLAGLQDPADPEAAEALRAAIPTEVTTVHRLLGSRPDTRHFRHHARNPLALDLLVLDEASMLDLEMMAAVLAALPTHAGLILLGDKDQLASVEAGAVLGDLCQRADAGHYRADTAAWLQATTGEMLGTDLCDAAGTDLDQAVVKLRVSHRFAGHSGIGRLAEAVNAGDVVAMRRVLGAGHADLASQTLANDAALRQLVLDGRPQAFGTPASGPAPIPPPVGYRHYLRVLHDSRPVADAPQPDFDTWAQRVLEAHGRFQLLCALRSGPQGVEGLNQRVAALLRAEDLLEPEQGGWFLGRPVLVMRNDYGLKLMNGDVGVTLALPVRVPVPVRVGDSASALLPPGAPRSLLRVAFADVEAPGGIRWVLPSRLREVQTVFAMTVHKSQGSEFSHTALLLPAQPSPVLTRELVYTGITRARHWCTLVADRPVLEAAVQRRVQRVGGLGEGWDR